MVWIGDLYCLYSLLGDLSFKLLNCAFIKSSFSLVSSLLYYKCSWFICAIESCLTLSISLAKTSARFVFRKLADSCWVSWCSELD